VGKTDFDLIIVGAGPAGLFTAHELCRRKKGKKLRIALIDRGEKVEKRKCPLTTISYSCPNCSICSIMSGIGGAGLFSDGKLGFTPILSLEKLNDFISKKEVEKLLNHVEETYLQFGVSSEVFPKEAEKVERLVKEAREHSVKLLVKKIRHVGSDMLPLIIKRFQSFLEKNGVKILENTNVEKILVVKDTVKGVKTNKGDLTAKYIVVAPGRAGAAWLSRELESIGVKKTNQPIWVGVRVEFPASIIEKLTNVFWEPFMYVRTNTFDDQVRNFCTCPHGFVAQEVYTDFVCVNGFSSINKVSNNSNFALLSEVVLTEPVEDTIKYGESIAKLATTIGGGKPIVQRFTDLKAGRRSTWKRIKKSYLEPTLKNVTPGDISMALPHRVVCNLIEALEKLNHFLPGITGDSTLIYAPEIKFTSARIDTNKKLETKVRNLFVAGDGAGVSSNIVGASCTGVLAARGILEKI